jgi:hypothetical protein
MAAVRSIVKRGKRNYGYLGMVPGFLAIFFLIFLPGFTGFLSTVNGPGIIPAPSDSESTGRIVVPFAIGAGLVGGVLAGILGLVTGWALAGYKHRFLPLFLLCLPIVLGESAAAGGFISTAGLSINRLIPSYGFLTLALFEAWRLTGPVAVVATLMMEPAGRKSLAGPLPPDQRLLAVWVKWRTLLFIAMVAGVLMAIMGAGHMQLAGDVRMLTIRPADPAWLNPSLRAAVAWTAFNWPVYIGAAFLLIGLVFRLPARTADLE